MKLKITKEILSL